MPEGHNKFHTYEIPDALPQGDDMFTLVHNNLAYDLVAGQAFDFTTIDPLSIDSFLLLGIDEIEFIETGDHAHPPFVNGATFMVPGIAEVTTFPLFYAEPGDFDQDTDIDGNDFLAWQRGESPDPLSPSDLADWQTGFGETLSPAVASTPEPSTLLLASLAGLLFCTRRR